MELLLVGLTRRRTHLGDRFRARGQQHGAIAGEVTRHRRDRAHAERDNGSDRHVPPDTAEVKHVEAEAEHDQKPDEREHHEPRPSAVRGLLFVQVQD